MPKLIRNVIIYHTPGRASELSIESGEYDVGLTFSFVIEQGITDSKEIGNSYLKLDKGTKKGAKATVYQEVSCSLLQDLDCG